MITSLVTLIIATVLATVVLLINPRDSSFRWFSISLYATGSNILVLVVDIGYPEMANVVINSMYFTSDASIAYSFGMFGIVYSELFDKGNSRKLMISGLIILAFVLFLTPLTPSRLINYEEYNELPMVLFIVVSLSSSVALLTVSYIKERHPYKKIERLLTNLLVQPMMLYIMASYSLYLFGIDLFQFNYTVAISFLILFVIIGVKKGALGVKIKIEMLKADASQHALISGTSLLNHTIKNEIGKVDLLLHQMKQTIEENTRSESTPDKEVVDMISTATDSVHHIQNMMTKINNRLQAIVVNLKKENILPVMEQCLEMLEKTVGDGVSVIRKLEPIQDIYVDSVHMKEVIINILNNAIESMDNRGVITVSLTETEKYIVLQIQDSGMGISEEVLPSVFDPFYSTKKMKNHYGLGLYYCKNVIRRHNGSIHVESTLGRGSSFYIHLQK